MDHNWFNCINAHAYLYCSHVNHSQLWSDHNFIEKQCKLDWSHALNRKMGQRFLTNQCSQTLAWSDVELRLVNICCGASFFVCVASQTVTSQQTFRIYSMPACLCETIEYIHSQRQIKAWMPSHILLQRMKGNSWNFQV